MLFGDIKEVRSYKNVYEDKNPENDCLYDGIVIKGF